MKEILKGFHSLLGYLKILSASAKRKVLVLRLHFDWNCLLSYLVIHKKLARNLLVELVSIE